MFLVKYDLDLSINTPLSAKEWKNLNNLLYPGNLEFVKKILQPHIIYQAEKSVILAHYTSIKKCPFFTDYANGAEGASLHHKFTPGPRYYQQKSYSFGIFMTPNLPR